MDKELVIISEAENGFWTLRSTIQINKFNVANEFNKLKKEFKNLKIVNLSSWLERKKKQELRFK